MNKKIFIHDRMAGALLVILAAVSWGMAGVLSQFLFRSEDTRLNSSHSDRSRMPSSA